MSSTEEARERLGRFEIRSEIGRGSHGIVYRAYDPDLDREVAVKRIAEFSPTNLYDLKREFRTVFGIRHPGLVELHELFIEDRVAFFSMELIDGPNLVTWLRRRGAIDAPEITELCAQLADSLHALHRAGRIHRDLKPANILVGADGRVMVLDFGLIETGPRDPYASRRTDQIVGTLAYMAPEALDGRHVTPAVDWYSMGALLHEAVTGAPPPRSLATGAPPSSALGAAAASLPREIAEAIESSLRIEPQERLGFAGWRAAVGPPTHPAWTRIPASWFEGASLVGRDAELERLTAACLPEQRDARIVAVRGPSGMGKTRLLEHFTEGLRADGQAVLQSRCRPSESVAYQALDGAIDGLARMLMQLTHDELRSLAPRPKPALARLFPVLQRIPELSAGEGADSGLEPHELRRSAVSALRELLGRLGRERRTVIWIDDAQWGDDASAAILAGLLEAPAPAFTLVLSSRSDLADHSPFLTRLNDAAPDSHVERIEVGPLAEGAVRRLCEQHLADLDQGARDAATRVVIEEAGGIPFFVDRMCAMLATGSRRVEDSRSQSASDLMAASIRGLPESARRMLGLLALAETPLTPRLFHGWRSASVADDSLTVLRRERWVREVPMGGSVAFEPYHDRIREAARAGRPAQEVIEDHDWLACALEAEGAAARSLVRHFLAAGRPEDGARCAAQAARDALLGLEFEGAARYFAIALSEWKWPRSGERDLQMGQAEALGNAGRAVEAAHLWLAAAEEAAEDVGLACRRRAAAGFLGSGRLDQGYEVLRAVLVREGVGIPQSPLQILWRTLIARSKATFWLRWRRQPRPGAPRRELERVDAFWHAAEILSMIDTGRGAYFQALHLAAALRCGEPSRMGRAMGLETSYRVASGWNRRPATRRLQQRALRLAEQGGDPLARAIAMGGRSLGLYMEGRWLESLEANEPIGEIYEKECVGIWWERATGVLYTMLACFRTGDIAAVRWLEHRWLADARDRGDLYTASSVAAVASARLRLIDDRVEDATEAVREGLSVGLRGEFLPQHFWSEREAVTIALYRGDALAARQTFDRLWPRLRASLLLYFVDIRIEALALRTRVALANAAVRKTSTVRDVRRDTFLLRLERPSWAKAHAAALRGVHQLRAGERQSALALLARGEEAFARADMPIEAACTRWRRADAAGGAEGERLRRDADVVLRGRGIVRPDRWVETVFPLGRLDAGSPASAPIAG